MENLNEFEKNINIQYAKVQNQLRKDNIKLDEFKQSTVRKQIKSQYTSLKTSISEDKSDKFPVDGDIYKGSQVFMNSCASCHNLVSEASTFRTAPDLGYIFGRISATDLLYKYSKSLEKVISYQVNIRWNSSLLFNFIQNGKPYDLVKSPSTVNFKKIKSKCNVQADKFYISESDTIDLVQFLKTFSIEYNTFAENNPSK